MTINELPIDEDTGLDEMISSLSPNLLVDTVGGALPGQILSKLNPGSNLLCVGNLENKPTEVDSNDLRWQDKSVNGFFLQRYLYSKTHEERREIFNTVQKDLENSGLLFSVKVLGKENFENWENVIMESAKYGS